MGSDAERETATGRFFYSALQLLLLNCTVLAVTILPTSAADAHIHLIVSDPLRNCQGPDLKLGGYFNSWPGSASADPAAAALRDTAVESGACELARKRFDAQLQERRLEVRKAADTISSFIYSHRTWAEREVPSDTGILLTSYPYGINGKLFGDTVVINLFATKDDDPREFRRLLLHEWIHGLKSQNIDGPDSAVKLLFWEGQAVYGAQVLRDGEWDEDSAAADLGFNRAGTDSGMKTLCAELRRGRGLDALAMPLFSGNDASLGKPRLGYLIGAKLYALMATGKAWNEIDYGYFSGHYGPLFDSLKGQYCEQK